MVTAIRPEPAPDFATLCTPLRTSLQAKAMHLTRDAHHAQDLVQDTYLHALTQWSSFVVPAGSDPNDRASAWLHRIMMNVFIDRCRTKTRHNNAHLAWPDDLNAATTPQGTVEQVHQSLSPTVARALESLDPIAREIVTRIDLNDEGYPEVAVALKLAIGTVKSKLHRARKQLAEEIERPRAKVVSLPPPARRFTGS